MSDLSPGFESFSGPELDAKIAMTKASFEAQMDTSTRNALDVELTTACVPEMFALKLGYLFDSIVGPKNSKRNRVITALHTKRGSDLFLVESETACDEYQKHISINDMAGCLMKFSFGFDCSGNFLYQSEIVYGTKLSEPERLHKIIQKIREVEDNRILLAYQDELE